MSSYLIGQLIGLGSLLLVGRAVWGYYRRRTYARAEKFSTFAPRFWTGTIDALVLWPVSFLTTSLLALNVHPVLAALLVIVENLAWFLYTALMHARCGQTVGKMVTKVRVVDFRTEGQISYRQAWLREGIPTALGLGLLGYEVFCILSGKILPAALANGAEVTEGPFWLLSSLPGFWFLAEVVTMLTNQKRRALHDFIAGTVVVRTNTLEERNPEIGTPSTNPPDASRAPAV